MNNPLITSSQKETLQEEKRGGLGGEQGESGVGERSTAKCRPEFDLFNENFSSVCGQNGATAKSTN